MSLAELVKPSFALSLPIGHHRLTVERVGVEYLPCENTTGRCENCTVKDVFFTSLPNGMEIKFDADGLYVPELPDGFETPLFNGLQPSICEELAEGDEVICLITFDAAGELQVAWCNLDTWIFTCTRYALLQKDEDGVTIVRDNLSLLDLSDLYDVEHYHHLRWRGKGSTTFSIMKIVKGPDGKRQYVDLETDPRFDSETLPYD